MPTELWNRLKKTNIPNSYYAVILLAVIAVALVGYIASFSGQKSDVSTTEEVTTRQPQSLIAQKATRLRMGMTRSEVIRMIGLPDWAVVWGDSGILSLPDEQIALELRWKNPECREISVMFDKSDRIIGWDDGTKFCRSGVLEEGREAYACSQPDRQRYCR